MSTTTMSPKLVESMMDIKNGNGAEINEFDDIG
jgi:hypothetical protein